MKAGASRHEPKYIFIPIAIAVGVLLVSAVAMGMLTRVILLRRENLRLRQDVEVDDPDAPFHAFVSEVQR